MRAQLKKILPGLVLFGLCALACGQDALSLVGTEPHYELRPGDIVRITVFEEPDLAVQQELDQQGVIVIPLLGRTSLVGQTLREAESFLEERYIEEDYLINPQVTVTISQYAEQVFYVYGEVNSPGAKPFPSGRQFLDILEAITLAGDLTQFAKRSEVILRRPIEGENREKKFTIDLEQIIRGSSRNTEQDLLRVYPQDIIYVPERLF